ncbi:CMP-sialic acid transporter 4 [Glycine soja]
MEYRKIKDEDEVRDAGVEDVGKSFLLSVPDNDLTSEGETKIDSHREKVKWKRKSVVTLALTVLTSSQGILIVWSKRAGKYEYSVTTANFMVETLKCAISLVALGRIWKKDGVNEDNRLTTTLDEVIVYPIPAALYLVKNLLQYYIFAYVDAPGYQILKNFNIISTGVLYRIILKKRLSEIQWAAFVLLAAGCTTAQLNSNSDRVLQTPFQGWVMAIVMALLSGFAGVYTEAIIKKRPSRNINVQNFWLYVFGMCFNAVAMLVQDFDAVMNKGFFHGYSFITVLMIFNHALSRGICYAELTNQLGVEWEYKEEEWVRGMLGLSSFELAKSRTLASVLGVLLFNHFPSFAWMLLLFLPEMKGYLRCGLWSMSDKKMKQLLMVDETVNKQISGSGIAVSMVMKYADNIVKVYSTSVAMLLTAVVSVFLFGFHLSLAFFLGTVVVSVAIYLHSAGKIQR